MNWMKFAWDRRIYIAGHYLMTLFIVLVIWLAFLGQDVQIGTANVIYLFVLSTFVLAASLAWDGMKQREFYRSLANAIDQGSQLNAFALLKEPVTNEQALFYEMAYRQYKAYNDELGMLRRAQEMHHFFTDQWVHHIKTPVSVIGLHVQQGPDAKSKEEALTLLASIGEENDRIVHSLEMMLHTARLDKFEMDAHLRRTPLLSVIRESINAHKKACIQWSIFPRIEAQEQEVYVETDVKWLRLVLDQLISNAIKYSKGKQGAKSLLAAVDRTEEGIRLSVKDAGIGIAEQDLPRVFDPFFTGENGRRSTESTGMGLYVARQVCRKLGHSIKIQSVLGEGTTVSILFSGTSIHKDVDQRNVTTM